MKALDLVMAISVIISQSATASPVPADPIARVNKTLADWGIIKVPDLGLLEGDPTNTTVLDKRQNAYTFQAFSGNYCNYEAGDLRPYGNDGPHCDKTGGRHSFRITGGPAYVSADNYPSCAHRDYTGVPGGLAYAGCYNVNTGMDWQSSYTYYAPR